MKMRQSEHDYSWLRKIMKGIRRVSFAIIILWSVGIYAESNSLVLNEAAARLGQSMRETEDELIRDMLAGTASVINCTNGTNGEIAVLKSYLIDLEVLPKDDRAQAARECAA